MVAENLAIRSKWGVPIPNPSLKSHLPRKAETIVVIGVHRRAGCTGRVAVVVVAVVIVLVLAVSGRVSHYPGGDHASGTVVVVICGPGPHRGGAGAIAQPGLYCSVNGASGRKPTMTGTLSPAESCGCWLGCRSNVWRRSLVLVWRASVGEAMTALVSRPTGCVALGPRSGALVHVSVAMISAACLIRYMHTEHKPRPASVCSSYCAARRRVTKSLELYPAFSARIVG